MDQKDEQDRDVSCERYPLDTTVVKPLSMFLQSLYRPRHRPNEGIKRPYSPQATILRLRLRNRRSDDRDLIPYGFVDLTKNIVGLQAL